MISNQCSPHKNANTRSAYTCFSKQELVELTKSLNSISNLNLKVSLDKKSLHQQLHNSFKQSFGCKNEACWIDQKNLVNTLPQTTRNDLLYYTFKPKIPSGKYFLLNTLDINLIMIQYEVLHPQFKFLGAIPSNTFDNSRTKKTLLNSINNYKHIGLIFNLDKRDQPGSHWVAIFINTHLKTIEYFDSLGDPPTNYIKKTLLYIHSHYHNYSLIINSRIHQQGNTACGIYSILFILFKLNHPNNYDYLNVTLPDSKVHPFRQKFFRPVNDL